MELNPFIFLLTLQEPKHSFYTNLDRLITLIKNDWERKASRGRESVQKAEDLISFVINSLRVDLTMIEKREGFFLDCARKVLLHIFYLL